MEIVSSVFDGSLRRMWRRRRYHRLDGSNRGKNVKIVTFGGRNKRFWRIKAIPRLHGLKKVSPVRFWIKFKNAYVKMMLGLSGIENIFGSKRVPKTIGASKTYSPEEFQSRLIYEISKNLFASRELATI